MKRKNRLTCKQCGSVWDAPLDNCLKCGWNLRLLNKSRTLEKDIAHNRQTLEEATNQLHAVVQQAKREKYGFIRLIVGGGQIGIESEKILSYLKYAKSIKSFSRENFNKGAFLIEL